MRIYDIVRWSAGTGPYESWSVGIWTESSGGTILSHIRGEGGPCYRGEGGHCNDSVTVGGRVGAYIQPYAIPFCHEGFVTLTGNRVGPSGPRRTPVAMTVLSAECDHRKFATRLRPPPARALTRETRYLYFTPVYTALYIQLYIRVYTAPHFQIRVFGKLRMSWIQNNRVSTRT